jgi:DNA-binding Xre family transcriptional regulator
MSLAVEIVTALKRSLRERGQTYAQLADALGISESSVKRMFSIGNMDLERLERICGLLGVEAGDLLELVRAESEQLTQLSEEQEGAIVSDPKLLLVAILATSHWTYPAILETYKFTEAQLVGHLAHLDRLRIVDLLPGNRIRVRLARNFTWRKSGPFQAFFEKRVQGRSSSIRPSWVKANCALP